MPPELPTELFDNIFFHLRASVDFVSLYTCTQVNSYFSALAELHLHYHLIVSDRNPHDKSPIKYSEDTLYKGHNPSQVLQLLADKPHILDKGYIRVLDLRVKADRSTGGILSDEARRLYDTELARLLSLLTNLERVAVRLPRYDRAEWTRLTKHLELQRALVYEVLCLPSVREVSLQGFNDFSLEVLEIPAALRGLRLECHLAVDALPSSDLPLCARTATGSSPCRPSLSSLALNDVEAMPVSHFLSWIESPRGYDLSRLESFEASISSPSDCMYIAYILSRCSGSLETLEFTSRSSFADIMFVNDFDTEVQHSSQQRHLQELGFHPHPFSFTPSTFLPSEPISLSAPFSLACLSSLEQLRLCLPVELRRPLSDSGLPKPVYAAPFELIQGILEEITAGRPRCTESFNSEDRVVEGVERNGHHLNSGDRHLPLQCLTLDLLFTWELMRKPFLLRRISWLPLTSALLSFREAMPLLKVVKLRAAVDGLLTKNSMVDRYMGNVLEVWKTDLHIRPLVTAGLLQISGKRIDTLTSMQNDLEIK